MNGLPLVVLGVMFFTLAYSLLKVQGKISDVSKAVGLGFKTIEDAISKNLIDPTGPMGGVSTAIDQNFQTIQDGITTSITGPDGALDKIKATLASTNNISSQVFSEIKSGRDMLTGTVAPLIGQTQDVFYNIGNPLKDASATIDNIGNWINVEILGEHPLIQLAQPFHDVAGTVGSTGTLSIDAGHKIGEISGEITKIADKLDNLNSQIISLRRQTDTLVFYIDGTLNTAVTNFSKGMDTVNASIDGVLFAFKTGGEASLKELESARAFLDSTLTKLVNKQWITVLAGAGIALILAGVSIGI